MARSKTPNATPARAKPSVSRASKPDEPRRCARWNMRTYPDIKAKLDTMSTADIEAMVRAWTPPH